jgi:hypothetical protein
MGGETEISVNVDVDFSPLEPFTFGCTHEMVDFTKLD